MNRSQRRAAVIKRLIAAGLLCAGLAAGVAVPAAADAGHDTDGVVASNNRAVGRGSQAAVSGATETVSPRTRRGVRTPLPNDDEWHPHPYWCELVWLPWPIDPPLPYTGNRNGIIAQLLPTPAAAPVAGGIVAAGVHASTGLTEAAPEAPPATAPAAPPAAAASSAGSAVAAAALPAASPPPAAAPPSVIRPESVAPPTNRVMPRLPDLPSTDLAGIAAVALPGLAGIAALTALGGFLGYRQAKAGYVLRAAGTARFLQ